MSIDKEKVLAMLGNGVSNEQVASALGCTHGYISQLMADESFSERVVALRVATLTEAASRDKRINVIEDKLIEKLEEAIEFVTKPRDIKEMFATVNAAKRRGVSSTEAMTINQQIVNLNIPPVVVRNFVQNTEGEVIEVEGQAMITMPAHQLLKSLMEGQDENSKEYARVSKHLPAAIQHGITQDGSIPASSRSEKIINSR
jgi:transcriptional regulator with XRE-family HTH domain